MPYQFHRIYMDFDKYRNNLKSQLAAVNSDIVEKEEELLKLKEFRSRVRGGLEAIKQIEEDVNSTPAAPPLQIQQDIRETVQELAQGWLPKSDHHVFLMGTSHKTHACFFDGCDSA